jgi:hypothetical protein
MFQHQLRVQFLLFHYQSYLNSSDNQKEWLKINIQQISFLCNIKRLIQTKIKRW